MTLSNYQALVALHEVRNRQIPWHKKATLFGTLKKLGLVAFADQKTLSNPDRPKVTIAVLTDKGRSELDRLSRLTNCPEWIVHKHLKYIVLSER